MWLSVIIPTYNEAENLKKLIPYLLECIDHESVEIIVVDSESEDDTLEVAKACGANLAIKSPKQGRGPQMNYGVTKARGKVLYFLHADTWPPSTFLSDIGQALTDGYELGCYRFRFDKDHPALRLNAYCTRFPFMICRGGDQSLFIRRDLFDQMGGFDEKYKIMEEYDFIRRVKKVSPFFIMDDEIVVSSRKYDNNSYPRVNFANLVVFTMFFLKVPQDFLVKTYRYLIDYR